MLLRSLLLGFSALALGASSCTAPSEADAGRPPVRTAADSLAAVPDWAADAVWYQIFPERFRNGDPTNDPTRASLETPIVPGPNWRVSPWTGDWYARDAWETAMGTDYYENGVFHRRYGGDLQGVIDKLGYLQTMGVTALYFNPVFEARSLHKYDGNTFHHIDPHFGPDPAGDFALMARETSDPKTWHVTRADQLFFDLVRAAHERGMRVVIDGVFNHTGRDFFAFDNLRTNQAASPYKDWYVVRRFDDPATDTSEFVYKGWWGTATLPEFANNPDSTDLHEGPKAYVFDATRRWMDPNGDGDPADGIDGWRLDVAEEVPVGFWADWNRHVREINPEAYTVSEIWGDASHFLREGGFSATMNYAGFAYPAKGFLVDRVMTPTAFRDTLAARRAWYPEAVQYALQNLMDSHDTDRLPSMIVNASLRRPFAEPGRFDYDWGGRVSPRSDNAYLVRAPNANERDLQRLIALFQVSYVGAPMFYYGTEAGMWGGDDPDDRKPMLWEDLTYAAETADPRGRTRARDANRFDSTLFRFYQRAIALRKGQSTLRRGGFEPLVADDAAGVFAFARVYEGRRIVVVLNPTDAARTVRVPVPGGVGRTPFKTLLASKPGPSAPVRQDAAALTVDLGARAGVVLGIE